MTDKPENRRRFERLPVNGEVILNVVHAETETTFHGIRGVAEDISAGGMRVRIHQLARTEATKILRPGASAQVYLTLPSEPEPFFFESELAWMHFLPAGRNQLAESIIGVCFDHQDEDIVRQFELFMQSLSRQSSDAVKTNNALAGRPLRRKL
jgi:c-di-GMP-binding flagellar brake protein YcgR